MSGWARSGDRIFVKKRYGNTMVGEVLFSDKISIERLLSLVTFIILLLAIFRIDLYEDHNYHRANESSFLKGLNPIQSQTLFVVLLWEGG